MTYTATMQSAMAFCRGELPSSQFSLLCFIIQRTERFGGKPETISYNEFLNGFTVGGVDTYVAPVTSDRTTLRKAIDGLEERQWLRVENTGGSNRYTLLSDNMLADDCKWKERMRRMLKTSKKYKKDKELDRSETTTTVGVKPLLGGSETTPTEVTDFKVTEEQVSESETGVSESVSYARLKNKQAMKKTVSRPTKSLKVLRAAWRLAVDRNNFTQTSTVIDKVTWGKCRQASSGHTAEDFLDLVDWSVENWASMKLTLSWATDLTELPELHKWCILYKHFHRAWAAEGTEEEIAKVVRDGSVDIEKIQMAEAAAQAARQRADAAVQKAEHLQRRISEKASTERRRARRASTGADTPIPEELPPWEDE